MTKPQRTRDTLPGGKKYPNIPRPLSRAELPGKYKGAERKVRVAIIALPIAIVTSWILWKRLVMGEERKRVILKAEHPTVLGEVGNLNEDERN